MEARVPLDAPDLIGPIDGEPSQQIGINPVLGVRRAGLRRLIDRCQAHLAQQPAQALSDCDHAVARDLKSAAALSNRGSVWLLAGEPKRALLDIETALALTPNDPSLYYNRGLAHAKLGANLKAIDGFTEAIRRKPDFAIAYHNRGYEHERLGETETAIADYRRALAIASGLKPTVDAIKRLQRGRL